MCLRKRKMASDQRLNLSEQNFHNWIKQGVALVITKEGLQDIVQNEIEQFQQNVYSEICKKKGIAENIICNACCTEDVIKCTSKNRICKYTDSKCMYSHKPCNLNICNDVRNAISKAHRYSCPSWKNTDARKWVSSSWELAKCFLPPDGYKDVSCANETDFNGIMSVFINYNPFQSKIHENLSSNSNLFYKAREIGREYRHNARFEVTNKQLMECLAVFSGLLKDAKHIAGDKNARHAVEILDQLRKNTWTITDKDISRHLQEAINEAKESFDKIKNKLLEQARQLIGSSKRQNINTALSQLQQNFSKHKEEIEDAAPHGIKRIRQESETASEQKRRKTGTEAYDLHKKDLRRRLFWTYKTRCANLPISPLLEEEELPLLTFYVQPFMRRVDHHRVQKEEVSVETYECIFYKGKSLCKNIYVTGDAGIGKTVMCQRMVLLWCLAHQYQIDYSDKSLCEESVQQDAKTMKSFDFLFYISLRDTTFCHIEDVILHHILGMSNSKDFILRVLRTEKCLVILDGLDEWVHPPEIKDCPSNIKVPHREGLENCVILTTSRPYKLERLRLKTHEIDQQVEILGMEEGVGFAFVELVVNLLNDKYGKKKDVETFLADVAENNLDDLLNVPLVTTHLICLWFDEKLRKMSISEVYANILDMMFQRAEQRKSRSETDTSTIENKDESNAKIPTSIANLEYVQKHISVLYKLSRLAFDTLFIEKDSNLVFSDHDLKRYGISKETNYLCSVGIMSKRKAIGYLTERRHKLAFPHKLYQEFMAALYISMSDEGKYIRESILKSCRSLADVKKFSDVFIFLASLRPCAVESLFQEVNAALSQDKDVEKFRECSCSVMFSFISQRRRQVEIVVKSLQDLAIKCFEECTRSGGKDINFKLQDIFIYKNNVAQIHAMLKSNKTCLKSIFSTESYLEEEMCSISGLVRLEIRYIKKSEDFEKYCQIMSASCATLKNISISYCDQIAELPFERLNNLKSLYIHNVKIKHDYLTKLIEFIATNNDMSQIGLDAVECEDHAHECSLGTFDLRNHTQLYLLGLGGIKFEAVEVNKSALFRLNLDYKESDNAASWAKALLESLMYASGLKKVVIRNVSEQSTVGALVNLVASLQNLQYIYLLKIDFYDNMLWLDPEGVDIEIEMSHVTLTSESFRDFLGSVAKRKSTVHVNLLFYSIQPPETNVLRCIESNSRLEVIRKTDVSLKFKTKDLEQMTHQ